MKQLSFWQSWPPAYRYLFIALLAVLAILTVLVPVLHIMGVNGLIPWHVFTREKAFTGLVNNFVTGPFSFAFEARRHVLLEVYSAGKMPDTAPAARALLALVAAAVGVYLALVSLLRRFAFLVAMGILLAFVIVFQVQSTGLFGWPDNLVLVFFFLLLLAPAYYVHAYRPAMGMASRLAVFTGVMLLLALAVGLGSDVYHPFNDLMGYGMLAVYLVAVVFVIAVAHEVVAALLTVVSAAGNLAHKTKVRHFLLISIIYLVNILLMFLYRARYIDWQLVDLNPFILLAVSAWLGVWGVRQRLQAEGTAGKEMQVYTLLYLVAAVLSLAALAFIMLEINDPFIQVLADLIIYAHLGIGVAFLLYVLYNFMPLLEKDYEVGRVLYKPQNLPFLTYRILSLMILIGMFAMRGLEYPIWYSMGGFSNTKGDLALSNGLTDIARAYYENGNRFAYHNHKSNYMLGMLLAGEEPDRAIRHFALASDRLPSAQSLANRANVQNKVQDYYNALFTLQEATRLLPEDPYLANNLAIQFERLRLTDSAAYYLQRAEPLPEALTNRLALAALYGINPGVDSLSALPPLTRQGRANAAALGLDAGLPLSGHAGHMFDYVYLANWLVAAPRPDSLLWQARTLIDSTADREYHDNLLYNWALAAASGGRVRQAVEALQYLQFNSEVLAPVAGRALGLLYLQNRAYGLATSALEALPAPPGPALAVARLENGDPEACRSYWITLADKPREALSGTARELVAALYTDPPQLTTDRHRYLYVRYNRYYIDDLSLLNHLNGISDNNLRLALALDLARFYHDQGKDEAALRFLTAASRWPMPPAEYKRYLILSALVSREPAYVQRQLNELDSLFGFGPGEELVALTLNHLAGASLDSADYQRLAADNPFFADAVLIGTGALADRDPLAGYSYLAEAVQRNPDSPVLLRAYIFSALDNGLEQFAENALYEYGQRFPGENYLLLRQEYSRHRQQLEEEEKGNEGYP